MLSAREWHVKHHRLKHGRLAREEECLRCMMARARCEGKKEFKTRDGADKAALAINIERNWWPDACLLAYRCRYCNLWHLMSAHRKRELDKVERMRKRWLRKTGQKDIEQNYELDSERREAS